MCVCAAYARETIASQVLPLTSATELHAVVLRDGPANTVRAFAAGYREDDAGDLQMAIVREPRGEGMEEGRCAFMPPTRQQGRWRCRG